MSRYLNRIFDISSKYLGQEFSTSEISELRELSNHLVDCDIDHTVKEFSRIYIEFVKRKYQSSRKKSQIDRFVDSPSKSVKGIWGDCLNVFQSMQSESIDLLVTSPPYYNAREYSTWKDLDAYLEDMSKIIQESYRVLDNHKAFVFNVGDITGNDNRHTSSTWGARRIPLGAYFIKIFEDVGYRFVDDFIWDKGQVESQRHKNGDTPYPFYQYPMNCYEHILVFFKHRLDQTRYPCPVCGCLKVNGNAYSGVGIKSWECKNLECFERSKANRGKRFSLRSLMMENMKTNQIESDFVAKWRRDIVPINPVIKINCKGDNILGHTAPFPSDVPNFAIRMYSGKGDVVVDPFAGSFTTPIEAVKLERQGVGIELNRDMFRESIISNIHKYELGLQETSWQSKTKSKSPAYLEKCTLP